jgi:hypothetical protein
VRLPILGRLTLPATGLLAATLAWGVMSAPAHAETDNPEPTTTSPTSTNPTSTEPTASEAATAALAQVQSILDPAPTDGVHPSDDSRDLTLALRDLRLHQDDLTARQKATVRRVAPQARPLPDSAPSKDFGTSVRVHWSATDTAATRNPQAWLDWVDHVGGVVTHVLATYKAAGYRAPLSDGALGGGNGRLDIYLVDFANDPHYSDPGLYGFCDAAVLPPAAGPYDTSAYCAFNHDFANFPALSPLKNLKVTAAHELFHATQFAYDYNEDAWFMEATATWAEDEVYDKINDNRQYLASSPISQPGQPLDQFGSSLRQYGEWIFFRYLSERFPQSQGTLPVIVRKMWQRADSSRGARYDKYSIRAVNRELAARGTDLRRVYAQFGAANRHPARTYEEGAYYPTAAAQRSWRFTPKHHDTRWQVARVDHLATRTVRVAPSRDMKRWRLRVTVDLPDTVRGVAAVVTKYNRSGRPTSRFVPVSKSGNGKARVVFDARKVRRVELTLSNAGIRYRKCWRGPARNGVSYSCSGVSRDDNRPLRYRVTAVR